MIYLLDTNVISDYLAGQPNVIGQVRQYLRLNERLVICLPMYYELLRGLLKSNATRKLAILQNEFIPLLDWELLTRTDWLQAARFWADTTSQGQQLSDVDLLIGAIAYRLNAIVVSSDNDFDALPVKRQDWREPL